MIQIIRDLFEETRRLYQNVHDKYFVYLGILVILPIVLPILTAMLLPIIGEQNAIVVITICVLILIAAGIALRHYFAPHWVLCTVAVFIFLLPIALSAWVDPVSEAMVLNCTFLCAFALAASWLAYRHETMEVVALIGLVPKPTAPVEDLKAVLKRWTSFVTSYLFLISIWTLFVVTLTPSRNFVLLFPLAIAIIVAFGATEKWNRSASFAKTIIYSWSLVVIVGCLLGMVSSERYMTSLGFDPVAWWRIRPIDHQLVATTEHKAAVKEKIQNKILQFADARADKVDDQIADTNSTLALQCLDASLETSMGAAVEIQKERSSRSVLGTFKRIGDYFKNPEGVEAADNPMVKIDKHSKDFWKVKFLTNEETRVLDIWPAGLTIVFDGPKKDEALRNDPAGGDTMFPLAVGYPLTRGVSKPLIMKYKAGGEITMNFSRGQQMAQN